MSRWGVKQKPFAVLGGGCHATLRGEHGAVSLSGTEASVAAAVEALIGERGAEREAPARAVVLRVVMADGKGGVAAMTFSFPPGHELTVADVSGMEDFASSKFKATMIALSWDWLPAPQEAAEAGQEGTAGHAERGVSEMADPPSIGRGEGEKGRKLRAVPPSA